jgi:hypothetical protein
MMKIYNRFGYASLAGIDSCIVVVLALLAR